MSYKKSKPLLTYQLNDQKYTESHQHSNIELLYILRGSLRVKVDGEEFNLTENDVIIINSNHKHSFFSTHDVFYVTLHLNDQMILSLLNASKIFYLCNSSIEDKQEYVTLQQLITNILKLTNDHSSNELDQQIGNLKLIDFLSKHFSVTYSRQDELPKQSNNRKKEIEEYVQDNYSKSISLKDLADFLFLSSPYVSKHFKEQFGMNFYKYLNHVRLSYAMDDLLSSKLSITSIAMNNGFPNVSAFNRWFKEVYKTTPHEYRMKHTNVNSGEDPQVYTKLQEYLKEILDSSIIDTDSSLQDIPVLSVSCKKQTPFYKYWTRVINLNEAAILRNFSLQDQIKALKDDLGFEYGRIWNIFSKEMKIIEDSNYRNINFFNLERIFDLFMELRIKPYVVFDPVSDFVNLGIDCIQDDEEKITAFISVFRSLMSHLINRYGLRQVQGWYFELIYTPHNELMPPSFYYRLFKTCKHFLLGYSSDFRVGGPGLPIHYSSEEITTFLADWFNESSPPDFLTLYSEFQSYDGMNGERTIRKLIDAQYIQNRVKMVRKIMEDLGHAPQDIQISNWDCSKSRLNMLNDSCYKAAHLMKNIIDCYGLLHGMGYWYGLDSLSSSADIPSLLYGGPGLLSRQGLKKPSYYAYAFLNIGESNYYLAKDNQSLITTNGTDNFFIVCHNVGSLNHNYYVEPHADNELLMYTDIFEKEAPVKLRYSISDVKNGVYKIKIRSVNETFGNIQQEWIKLNRGNELSKSEIDYLRQISIPRMKIEQIEVTNGRLELETELSRNEIQSIRITYQY